MPKLEIGSLVRNPKTGMIWRYSGDWWELVAHANEPNSYSGKPIGYRIMAWSPPLPPNGNFEIMDPLDAFVYEVRHK